MTMARSTLESLKTNMIVRLPHIALTLPSILTPLYNLYILYIDKKRLKEQSQNADQKIAKKTQKILQEVNNVTQQKNSLLNYMKPGVPTAPKVQHKMSSKYTILLHV